jgi:hypothetical protein
MYRQIMQDAAYKTSVEFPISCFRCNPKSCANENTYHRYDTLAPKIQRSWTHYMKTIPNENRFPISGMDNLDEFFSHELNRKRNYLFEYNPSIVLLPDQEKRSFKHPNTGGSVVAVYLASYRVSNMFWCFDMKYHRKLVHHKNRTDWLGLAYLDADFGILAEGVFDLGGEDYRLFTLRAPNGSQQIYLTDTCRFKLSLKQPAINSHPRYPLFNKTTSGEIISTIYVGSTSCRTLSDGRIAGKNIAYFDDATITTETMSKNNVISADANHSNLVAVAENWPPQDDGTHQLSFIDLSSRRSTSKTRLLNDGEIVSHPMNKNPIQPSFYTIEEAWFGEYLLSNTRPWEHERGNACCLDMIDPRTNKHVLVGISHANVRSNDDSSQYEVLPEPTLFEELFLPGHNSYLSRFYAFEPTAPYRTVALSGHFCWPMPMISSTPSSSTAENNVSASDGNPYVSRGQSLLYLEPTNQTSVGSCPKIHFVMSLLYKAKSNKKSIIVSYGVNDCTPRFIEIKASDVQQLLFNGL